MRADRHARWRMKYTKEWWISEWTHTWAIVGAEISVHLNIRPFKGMNNVLTHSGGVEAHFRKPPPYRKGEAPDYIDCPYNNGLCWHDGTSSYASDVFIPMFLRKADDEEIFSELIRHAEQLLEGGDED